MWARKSDIVAVILAGVAGLVLGVPIVLALYHNYQRVGLQTTAQTYVLDVAATNGARAKGLSDRQSMSPNRGMLFIYPDDTRHCFWMKDMHFPLDIIWIDPSKRVTHVEPGVPPNSYPQTFCPTAPAQYVIELNAGQAQLADIRPGQTLSF